MGLGRGDSIVIVLDPLVPVLVGCDCCDVVCGCCCAVVIAAIVVCEGFSICLSWLFFELSKYVMASLSVFVSMSNELWLPSYMVPPRAMSFGSSFKQFMALILQPEALLPSPRQPPSVCTNRLNVLWMYFETSFASKQCLLLLSKALLHWESAP